MFIMKIKIKKIIDRDINDLTFKQAIKKDGVYYIRGYHNERLIVLNGQAINWRIFDVCVDGKHLNSVSYSFFPSEEKIEMIFDE